MWRTANEPCMKPPGRASPSVAYWLQMTVPPSPLCLRGSGEVLPLRRPGIRGLSRAGYLAAVSSLAHSRARRPYPDLPRPPVRQFVGPIRDKAVLGTDRGQFGKLARDLLPDPAERDSEDPLAAREEVDDLVGRRALIHAHAVTHQRDLGQVLGPAFAQVVDCRPDLLQRDPGVKQALDHLEHEDVAEPVQALRTGTVRGPDARLDESGACPVIELAIGDSRRGARRRRAIADLGVAIEEHALHGSRSGPTPCYRHGGLL